MVPKRLLISFSGGETSAYMTQWILKNWKHKYDEIVVVFANTGQENEETLRFVKECDAYFGFQTVWIEATQHHGIRKGAGFKLVDYLTASREGEPFEDAIRKYGIPNQAFPHCTRALKLEPIRSYTRSIGWGRNTYDTAIGIRSDEIDRMSSKASTERIIYPLISDHPTTKPNINTWWASQPFRLGLKGYQGNCKWCWKKTLRKHLTIIDETPEVFNFPRRMEQQHGLVGPEFLKSTSEGYRRVFFRKRMSTDDLFVIYEKEKDTFVRASDDAVVFDEDFDVGAGCEESCEVFSDADLQDEKPEIILWTP